MTHTYNITGMTCDNCRSTVQAQLLQVKGVKSVNVELKKGIATLEMEEHVSLKTLQAALKEHPKYSITESHSVALPEEKREASFISVYKPVLLIFLYLTIVSLISSFSGNSFLLPVAMRVFMSGFFLTFSFFKMLDLRAFVDSYAMYDIVAKRFKAWGFIYPFIELALGFFYACNYDPLLINVVTFSVMSVSLVGVIKSVLNKTKIRCACLGAVFNLPMSSVTIIEDGLMIIMSLIMMSMLLLN
ncbi:MAG: heavy metal transporter [Bacteroidetes bacterium]|nr:heavy metal transporter [Bacteroidota bacterium]